MTSIDDERKAAEDAKAVLSSLKPSTPRFKAQIDILRVAYLAATNAMVPQLLSQMPLVHTRDAAVNALREVSHKWTNGTLTREVIFGAKDAVEEWLKLLRRRRHPTATAAARAIRLLSMVEAYLTPA
jgi:hypothetical protein